MKIGLIGDRAIARYVRAGVSAQGHAVCATLMRPERSGESADWVGSVAELPRDLDMVIDCAGHAALAAHGPAILARGTDLLTVSVGALADETVASALAGAAEQGGAVLHLASGAIGALDCLRAARIGGLARVRYMGRKPPAGWKGSPAEAVLDLDSMTTGAATHFEGSAREAALAYPKNANVAAAVALAGAGFDATRVELIADAEAAANIHEIEAEGAFGRFRFEVRGAALPDNPKSSALAAMSVLAEVARQNSVIRG